MPPAKAVDKLNESGIITTSTRENPEKYRRIRMISKLKAALFCQAVGDAMGDEHEFRSLVTPEQVRGTLDARYKVGITDDTQMTYFGMKAMTTVLNEGDAQESARRHAALEKEYLNWYGTQRGIQPKGVPKVIVACRAPGGACMSSLSQLNRTGTRKPNDKHGCGSVMRLLPFVFLPLPFPERLDIALMSGRITHDSPKSDDAVALYMTMAEIALKGDMDDFMAAVPSRIQKALHIHDLGAGFYAEECVDMAIWAVYKSSSFETCITRAIAHGGDSDSVAAVAGSLWGMLTGDMPDEKHLKRLMERKALEAVCDKYQASIEAYKPA
jgi:ADP-ribosyl-[dinitrogen reductase] hydrolase